MSNEKHFWLNESIFFNLKKEMKYPKRRLTGKNSNNRINYFKGFGFIHSNIF